MFVFIAIAMLQIDTDVHPDALQFWLFGFVPLVVSALVLLGATLRHMMAYSKVYFEDNALVRSGELASIWQCLLSGGPFVSLITLYLVATSSARSTSIYSDAAVGMRQRCNLAIVFNAIVFIWITSNLITGRAPSLVDMARKNAARKTNGGAAQP